jgi:hypothetical protein
MPPALPAEAAEITRVGAGEFVRHYFQVLPYAFATGHVEPLAEISADNCIGCQRSIENVRETYAAGNHFVFGETTLHGAESLTIEPAEYAEVFVLFSSEDTEEVAPDGTVVSTIPGKDNRRMQFILENADGRWLVREIIELEDAS